MSLTIWYEQHQKKIAATIFIIFTAAMLYVMHPSWFD